MSDPEFMRRVRAAVRGSREPRPVRLARSQPQQRGFGARPKLVDMSKFEGSVFCGSFRSETIVACPPLKVLGCDDPSSPFLNPR